MGSIEDFKRKIDEIEKFCKENDVEYERKGEYNIKFHIIGYVNVHVLDSEYGPYIEISEGNEKKFSHRDASLGRNLEVEVEEQSPKEYHKQLHSLAESMDVYKVYVNGKLVAEACQSRGTYTSSVKDYKDL